MLKQLRLLQRLMVMVIWHGKPIGHFSLPAGDYLVQEIEDPMAAGSIGSGYRWLVMHQRSKTNGLRPLIEKQINQAIGERCFQGRRVPKIKEVQVGLPVHHINNGPNIRLVAIPQLLDNPIGMLILNRFSWIIDSKSFKKAAGF